MVQKLCRIPRWKFFCVAFALCLLVFGFAGVMDNYYNGDTYFILATGRYITENGLPETNPFVIHEGLEMPVHQWLYDVCVYRAYSLLGVDGLIAAAMLLFCLLIGSSFLYVRQFTRHFPLQLITTTALLWGFRPWLSLRPTFLSMSIFMLMQCCFWQYRNTGKKLWLCPPVLFSVVEVNFHTSLWIMGPVLMLPHLLPATLPKKGAWKDWLSDWRRDCVPLLICFVAVIAAGFANPYGWKGMLYPLLSYGVVTNDISIHELAAPAVLSWDGILIFAAMFLFVFHLREKKLHQIDVRLSALLLGTAFLSAMHIRNIWFLLIGAIPTLMPLLDRWITGMEVRKANVITEENPDEKELRTQLVFRLEILVVAAVLLGVGFSTIRFPRSGPGSQTPAGAADYLDTLDKEDIVLYTGFNNGAYMEWRGYKGYMDARPEIYSKKLNGTKDVLAEYCTILDGSADYAVWLEEYQFTHLLVYENCLNAYLQARDDYIIVWQDGTNTLYERADF